jgi:hypothetical protein
MSVSLSLTQLGLRLVSFNDKIMSVLTSTERLHGATNRGAPTRGDSESVPPDNDTAQMSSIDKGTIEYDPKRDTSGSDPKEI